MSGTSRCLNTGEPPRVRENCGAEFVQVNGGSRLLPAEGKKQALSDSCVLMAGTSRALRAAGE